MPINKKQLLRLIKFVAEMRRNGYPNASSFARMLQQIDVRENLNIACSERTIMRDLQVLKRDFGAPIVFSSEDNGYYLENPFWEFQVPLFGDEMVMSSMLGARLAEDLLPSPVKEQIRDAVDEELSANNSEFLDRTFLESLMVAAGTKVEVDPGIFDVVFAGWRGRKCLHMWYCNSSGAVSERDVAPHVLAYHKGSWYVKGVDYSKEKIAVFAVHRIEKATLSRNEFRIDRALVEDVHRNGLFDYPKIEGITVCCAREIAYYLYEQKGTKGLSITVGDDGLLRVVLPPSPEHEAMRWILGEGGNVEVLSPAWLREKVRLAALKTVEVNGDEEE